MSITRRFVPILMLVLGFALTFGVSHAQQTFTEQDAIAIAAESSAFQEGLANTPGWTAAAYDTGNRYGIWRVQFWDSAGEEIGWADVSPARGKMYSWEAQFDATDAQRQVAQDALRSFIDNHPAVLELVEDPSQYEIYLDYDQTNHWWGVYLDIGQDSLYFVVRFEDESLQEFTNPQMIRLYFANVMSYWEWQESTRAQAVATGFKQPEIADALNGIAGWTTSAERDDEGLWTVYFLDGETVIAWVKVDMATETVVEFGVEE